MAPARWYARGIRVLGRTAVECTRDDLARRIAGDVAALAAVAPARDSTVVDPFAGSGNTIHWILREVPRATGLAFELDPQVYELSRRNLAGMNARVTWAAGDYERMLRDFSISPDRLVIAFVAPPWGTALDEQIGLDLRRTSPPVTDVIAALRRCYPRHQMICAVQNYEKLNPNSLEQVCAMFDWSRRRAFHLSARGTNHGLLLGTTGWRPGKTAD
jgi:hypothetical protein